MRRRGLPHLRQIVLAAGLAVAAPGLRAQAPACAPARTALVLGGGGSKGFAHVGLLQVMDSLGLKPDPIVGTSIGAIMGALYASGYTGREIEKIMKDQPLSQLVRGYEPQLPQVMPDLRAVAVWERDTALGFRLQSGAVREGEVNAMMSAMLLRGNILARGNFDSLPIPFRAVATDLGTRKAVSLGRGDLARAVRASFAIPLVFQPVPIDDRPLADGGLAENVPWKTARAMGATRLVISTLPHKPADLRAYRDPLAMADRLADFLFTDDSIPLAEGDLLIVQRVADVNQLDFSAELADSLIASGRREAERAFAGAPCVRPLAAPRQVPMPTRVGAVTVANETPMDRMALRGALGLEPGTPIVLDTVARRLRALGESENYTGVWLHPGGRDSTARFDLAVDRTPDRVTALGVAYDNDMVGRLWFGVAERGAFGSDVAAAVVTRLGKYRQDVSLTLRRQSLAANRLVPLTLVVSLGREDVRQLAVVGGRPLEGPSIEVNEAQLFYGIVSNSAWLAWRVGAVAHSWQEPARGRTLAGGINGSMAWLRDDGSPRFALEGWLTNEYRSLSLSGSLDFNLSGVEVRPNLFVGVAERLPLNKWFMLGGTSGFPGFRITENRGEGTVYGGAMFRRRLAGLLRLRADVMGGAISYGDGFLEKRTGPLDGYTATWYYGVRLGIEASTPLGVIIVQEGRNSDGRRGLFLRIGKWF